MKKRSNLLFLGLAILFALPALIGLFHQGFFLSDDGNWMVIRFSAFYEALRNGQFPVRFLFRLNNGFGYPVADFLYPLFMYLGVPIHILGINFVNSVKIILGLSLIFSSIFTFLWLRKLFDNLSSFLGATLYTLFPYHLFDIYKRGSVGEALALSIAPFIFWQIERKNYIFTGVGIALLITAHNSLAFIFLPFIILYLLLKKQTFDLIKSLLIGIGLSAFFWLPAIYDKQFTVFDKTAVSDFSGYFVTLKDLNLLGVVFFVVILGAFSVLFLRKTKEYLYFLLTTLLLAALVFPFSFIFWQYFPLVNYIQFPFRLISYLLLGSAYLAASQINLLQGKIKILFTLLFLGVILYSTKDFIMPKTYQYYPDSFYSTNQDTTTVKNEYMPKWVKKAPSFQKEKVTIVMGKGEVKNLITNGNKTTFSLNSEGKSLLEFNGVYFPGWKIKVDDRETNIDYKANGLIRFTVDNGSHNVIIYFTETPLRIFADLISLFSLIALLILVIKKRRLLFK